MTVSASPFATQMLSDPAVIPSGPSPTSIVCTTSRSSGSIRETELLMPFVTHTDPNAATTPRGSVADADRLGRRR